MIRMSMDTTTTYMVASVLVDNPHFSIPLIFRPSSPDCVTRSTYVLCFGVLASRVAINCSAAGAQQLFRARTISLAGISCRRHGGCRHCPHGWWSLRRETPANKPAPLSSLKISGTQVASVPTDASRPDRPAHGSVASHLTCWRECPSRHFHS